MNEQISYHFTAIYQLCSVSLCAIGNMGNCASAGDWSLGCLHNWLDVAGLVV